LGCLDLSTETHSITIFSLDIRNTCRWFRVKVEAVKAAHDWKIKPPRNARHLTSNITKRDTSRAAFKTDIDH
jgi:hypothetical protein